MNELTQSNDVKRLPSAGIVDYELVKWHFYAGVLYLLIAILAGLTYSLQFLQRYPFPGI